MQRPACTDLGGAEFNEEHSVEEGAQSSNKRGWSDRCADGELLQKELQLVAAVDVVDEKEDLLRGGGLSLASRVAPLSERVDTVWRMKGGKELIALDGGRGEGAEGRSRAAPSPGESRA